MSVDIRQYVSFFLGKEKYCVGIEYVQEIIRLPELTKVPLVPSFIEGVANLRGSILSVINGRVRIGLDKKEFDDTCRVVVLDNKFTKAGFLVDKVSDVISVSLHDIEARSESEGEFVEGIIKYGNEIILVLDVDRLLVAVRGSLGKRMSSEQKVYKQKEEERLDSEKELQFVSFLLSEDEYAIDIVDVQEIIHIPSFVSQVPGTSGYFEGVTTLRGKTLPLMRLNYLLGVGAACEDERSRIVVVNFCLNKKKVTAGFAVDSVTEVLRVAESRIEPVPEIMADRNASLIRGICNLEGGRRLVKVLELRKMLDEREYDLLDVDDADSQQSESDVLVKDDEAQYVTFLLGGQEYGAPIFQVQEIMKVPFVYRVPRSPQFIEGVVNIRGQIVPVMDLRKRLGLEEASRCEANRIIVADVGKSRIGLVVDAVKDVLKIRKKDVEGVPDLIVSRDNVFISGIGKARKGDRVTILVDFSRLLTSKEESELENFGDQEIQSADCR